jgi:hypothetical protein
MECFLPLNPDNPLLLKLDLPTAPNSHSFPPGYSPQVSKDLIRLEVFFRQRSLFP